MHRYVNPNRKYCRSCGEWHKLAPEVMRCPETNRLIREKARRDSPLPNYRSDLEKQGGIG